MKMLQSPLRTGKVNVTVQKWTEEICALKMCEKSEGTKNLERKREIVFMYELVDLLK